MRNKKLKPFKIFAIFPLLIFILSCKSDYTNVGIITIDVNKKYPQKILQPESFSHIEYVILDDTDDFLFKGHPQCITDNIIVIYDLVSGDFMFFSRQGYPISKFNAKGDGPNQFNSFSTLYYDENKDEIFIFTGNKVLVYSSTGKFIRSFKFSEDILIVEVQQLDENSLIVFDELESFESDFFLISKENGEVLEFISMPKYEKPQLYVMEMTEKSMNIVMAKTFNIVNHQDGFLLTNYSQDTVYLFDSDKKLTPFLVRNPKTQEMHPLVYLNTGVETSQYQFFQTIRVEKQNNQLPSKCIWRDKTNNNIFTQKIILGEFRGKLFEITPECISKTKNNKTGFLELDKDELQYANLDGKLSGRSKEITNHSIDSNNENNIYMFVYFD